MMQSAPLPWYWVDLKDVITLVVAITVASIGLLTYRKTLETRRAELLARLHQDFFVSATYKKIRRVLDDETPEGEIARQKLTKSESDEFTDFLNFFELFAYLTELGTFKIEDMRALLGYYLKLLRKSHSIYDYICDEKNGFENLKTLLATLLV